MARVKMVRCYLRSPGEAPSLRFIPLREFSLWKYYMSQRHEKIVEGEEISLWVDAQTYGASTSPQARPLEPVVRVDLDYWMAESQVAIPVQRYFSLEDYQSVREVFMQHYPEAMDSAGHPVSRRRVHEVKGYFLQRQPPKAHR